MLGDPELDTVLQVGSHKKKKKDKKGGKKITDKFINLQHSLCYLLHEDGACEGQTQCKKSSDKRMLI